MKMFIFPLIDRFTIDLMIDKRPSSLMKCVNTVYDCQFYLLDSLHCNSNR